MFALRIFKEKLLSREEKKICLVLTKTLYT